MRILIISNYFPPFELGGWGQLTRDVAQRLQGRGHHVYTLTSNYRAAEMPDPEPDVARVLHLESPDHVRYHLSYTLTHRWQESQNRRVLRRAVADFTPDLIFINGMWNLPVSLAQQAEQLCPGRVVYYVASHWPAELDAHTAYWNNANGISKRVLGALVRKTLLVSTPRNQLHFPLVLCVSAFMQEHMINEAHIPRERTRVVHNGVELDAFTARSAQWSSAVLRLLYAGRLAADKGVHTIIESLGHLWQSHPDLPVSLSLVGGGDPDYEVRLRQLVDRFNLEKAVRFWGRVPRAEMPAIFHEHEVLLFPSIWPEPLARVVQEGMACGLVVIGTTTGGTPEILYDGENGLTFEAGNAVMLASKIVQVAGDRDLWARLAQAARRTVEECFTLERMVDELEDYFSQIARQPEFSQ